MILIATFQSQSVSYVLSQEHVSDEITPPTFPLVTSFSASAWLSGDSIALSPTFRLSEDESCHSS